MGLLACVFCFLALVSCVTLAAKCASETTVVVGAGLAGLSAANALHRFGCPVIILEARDRLGGRCFTLPAGHAFHGHDAGAHWMHGGTANVILKKLASELGVTTVDIGEDNYAWQKGSLIRMFDVNGDRLSSVVADQTFDLFESLQDAVDNAGTTREENDLPDITAQAAIDSYLSTASLTALQQRAIGLHISVEYDNDAGTSPSNLGAISLAEDEIVDFEDESTGDRVFQGGCVSFIDKLSPQLDIRLSTTVSKIEKLSNGNIQITHNNGVINATNVIVTVPVNPLQQGSVEFSPAMSTSWNSALSQIELGNVMKVMLKFESAFWDSSVYSFGYMSGSGSSRGRYPFWMNSNFEGKTDNVLVCFVGGDEATRIQSLTDSQIEAEAMEVLRTMFGAGNVTTLQGSFVTRLGQDPTTLGAWSHIKLNGRTSAMEEIAQPLWDGHLHFAGEHTCKLMFSTIHAAVVSGLRVADRLLGVSDAKATWGMMEFANACEQDVSASSASGLVVWGWVLALLVWRWL